MEDIIRVMVAEDSVDAMEIILKQLNKFESLRIKLDECESFQKGLVKIKEAQQKKEPYHFLFIDIDFTGDDAGGKRDSGFNLIKKAFQLCPLSKIATYSAQYKYADLEPTHQEMVKNGLVVYTFDKDHRKEKPEEWFSDGFKKLITEFEQEKWLWEIWRNHEKINTKLLNTVLSEDKFISRNRRDEITSNLEAIIFVLQRRAQFNADAILFRLILQLYHRSMEIFITRDKNEEDIFKESEVNRPKVFEFVKDLLGSEPALEFKDKKSFLRKLTAFSFGKEYRYGHILNWYRNGSVHTDKKFIPDLANVIFANLTFSHYTIGKKENISISEIESLLTDRNFQDENKKGLTDLKSLIEFIKQ